MANPTIIPITPEEQRNADSIFSIALRSAERDAEHGVAPWKLWNQAHILSIFRLTEAQVTTALEGIAPEHYRRRRAGTVEHVVFAFEKDYTTVEGLIEQSYPNIPLGGHSAEMTPLF